MDHLKLPQFWAKDKDATMPGTPVDMESSALEMESIKNIHVSKKHSRQHQKDAGLKQARTSTTVASKSIPSPEQAVDIPGESDGDAPGANEEEEEFECNDVQFAKSVQESKRAHGV